MRTRQHLSFLGVALLGLALTAVPAHAQFFNAVFSREGIDVIAVGDSGAVYRSVNGGAHWINTRVGDKPLRDVVERGWTVVVVGDSGKVWRSVDNGGNWSLAVMSGTPSLRRLEALGGDSLIAVGSGGTVLVSTDGGGTWGAAASGTSEQLNSVRFVDGQNGWVAGANGYLARTADGGASWTPVALGTANHLNCVDAKGGTVWVVGDNATAFRSTDGGLNWTQLNLHADARPDVKAVWVQSADTVYITGGGGFIRRSVDGGSTWTFLQHPLQGQISDLYFLGQNGWAASSRARAVLRTTDGGVSWSAPAGAVTNRSWSQRFVASGSRGSTFGVNPVYKSTLYCAMGAYVYRSRDDGENWSYLATIPGVNTYVTNAFVVSAKDSNYWVAAVKSPDRIVWTDDGGATWNDALPHAFGTYGIPLEVDPDRPDTMYFGGDSDSLYRSIDRGKTWSKYSTTFFRSPCDIVVVPESDSSVILVGDGITGSGNGKYWRTANGSTTFTDQGTVSGSEIPGLACSRLRNSVAFGTNWAGGGVQRSVNYGLNWPGVSFVSQSWGVSIAGDDPDCVIFGVYSGATGYLSLTGGANGSYFAIPGLNGSNYSFYARDRATILAEQSNGIYKLNVTQTLPFTAQSVLVTSPNGGESWQPGSVHNITWNSTNVVVARIEYRRSSTDLFQLVGEVEGYQGSYAWTVPYDATADARIRVIDGWDQTPSDVSNQPFTIPLALIAETPASLGFGSHPIGGATLRVVQVSNPGTAPLVLSSIATSSGTFRVGRSSFTLAPGATDTVGVTFLPGASVAYSDSVVIASNGYNAATWVVPLYGSGMDTVVVDLAVPDGGEEWRFGTAQKIEWQSALVSAVDLAYQTSASGPWIGIADSVADAAKSYVWVIPNAPTSECAVRVQRHGGGAEDVSKAVFRITVPYLAAEPSVVDVGASGVYELRGDTLRLENTGSAPLTISSVVSSDPQFWPGRSSLVIPPGASDTLGVYYQPSAAGYDTATFTLAADDPGTPHAVLVVGRAVPVVAVGEGGPAAFGLWQNRPNPFAGRTQIRYSLPVSAKVSLQVFNLQGQRVATLVEGEQPAGDYSVSFGPGAGTPSGARRGTVPAGIYFYRFRAGAFAATRKMVVME